MNLFIDQIKINLIKNIGIHDKLFNFKEILILHTFVFMNLYS